MVDINCRSRKDNDFNAIFLLTLYVRLRILELVSSHSGESMNSEQLRK